MRAYLNKSGRSGILGYESGEDYIRVWFTYTEASYLYNSIKPGKKEVDEMKKLAVAGEGLNKFINHQVSDNYYE